MQTIASLHQVTHADRTVTRALSSGFGVAFVQSRAGATSHGLERYREALMGAQVPTTVLASAEELKGAIEPEAVWVVAFDAEDVSQQELGRILEMQSSAAASASSVFLIAWCSQGTSPATLWRLFQAGAYLCEKNASPEVLLRSCRHAAQGARVPLLRFTDQAGLSTAERRAFFAECAGLTKCEAADEIGCSQRTLETYWSRIFAKLRIRSTDGVIAAALRFAMLDPGTARA